jgi:general secretion pathway protein H
MIKTTHKGFTLIEILIVVVILSILTVMGVQMVSSGSVERNLKQHAKILQSTIEYVCDQATLQNIPYGVRFFNSAYVFLQFNNQQWQEIFSDDINFNKELTDGSILSLEIDDQFVVLNDDEIEIPHIMCDTTGQMTAFALTVSDATQQHHYQLKTIDFWQLQGQWLDATQSK